MCEQLSEQTSELRESRKRETELELKMKRMTGDYNELKDLASSISANLNDFINEQQKEKLSLLRNFSLGDNNNKDVAIVPDEYFTKTLLEAQEDAANVRRALKEATFIANGEEVVGE